MDYVKLEGSVVLPARVEGLSDVFQSPHFTLVKPPWVPDEQSTHCELCSTKFTQLKRRHHCRMCGAVRCAKCCSEKIPLPQLGLEEAERVCESCRTVAKLVTKARSTVLSFLIESAKGLASFSKHDRYIKKLVELGGIQTLVTLASTDNAVVLGQVISALHSLSTHPALHKCLADAGAIKAVCKILSTISDTNEQIAIDGISALIIFCKSVNLKSKALDDGGLHPVLSLCWSENDTIALLSIRTLGMIAELPGNHAAIFDNKHNAVPRLLQMSSSKDEQMQEVALKTLALLSMGSQEYKHRLVQEDFSLGRSIQKAFDSTPNNPQVLCNAACLVANLASSPQDQTGLQDMLPSACTKLSLAESNTELLAHLTRALANFAQHKQNTMHLVSALPSIIKYCLKSSMAPVQAQSMRLILSLLAQAPARVTSLLMSDGGQQFLNNLAGIPSLLNTVQASLLAEAPDTVSPL